MVCGEFLRDRMLKYILEKESRLWEKVSVLLLQHGTEIEFQSLGSFS